MRHLLLLSASKLAGWAFLMYGAQEIKSFLGETKKILYIPYAGTDYDGDLRLARIPFNTLGYEIESIHTAGNPRKTLESSEAVFIGGGNTFRLLKALHATDLLGVLRANAESGLSYIGASAGAVLASPTIQTTNDMPIIVPPSLEALGLIRVQINAHFPEKETASGLFETREERLREFLAENETPVLALREGAMLEVNDKIAKIIGRNTARYFEKGQTPIDIQSGETLNFVL